MRRALACALVGVTLSGCGGARGPSADVRRAAAAAAVTIAAAAASELVRSHGRRHTETGYEAPQGGLEGDEALVEPRSLDSEPSHRAPLALWSVPYAVEVNAEDLWCEGDSDCARLEGVDGCPLEGGGVDVAVRRSSLPRLRAELSAAAPMRACPGGHDASREAEVACVNGLCRLVRTPARAPAPPPPEATSLPPVPAPPGAPSDPHALPPVPPPP